MTAALRKLRRLPSGERRLLLEALLLVIGVRLSLWLLPFPSVRALHRRLARPSIRARAPDLSAEQVARAVIRAARPVPSAACLPQALAAQTLLSHVGHPVRVQIGVAKGPAGQLEAHAWVESAGRTLVGGRDAGRYARLWSIETDGAG